MLALSPIIYHRWVWGVGEHAQSATETDPDHRTEFRSLKLLEHCISLSSRLSSSSMASQLTSGNVRLDDVKQLVENLNIFTLDTHNFFESAGSLKPLDLPLVDSPAGGFLKCFVDIISDVSDFPPTEIKQALVSKKIHDLPAPYGLTQKIDLPTKLDIAIIKQNNGTFCVVKIVNLKEKVKVSRVQNL